LRDRARDGLLYALGGFALLSIGDALVKSMAGQWPGPAIAALRYVIGAFGLGTFLLLREGRAGFRMTGTRWHVLRGFGVALSATTLFTAVQIMPIAEATAISFTSPMVTALLAAALLGEAMRRETWIASLIAFAGVLIVLRPNFAVIGPAALLPLFSALGMALLMIGNRAVAGRASALAMQFNVALFAMGFLLLFTLAGHLSGIRMLHVGMPPLGVLAKSATIAVSASGAHALIYMATTRAGAGTIAPMTYVQLMMAGFFGWLLFHERPDATALAGAAIIVGAGLYLWRAGRMTDEPQGTD
jgi:drug/metabolite transporter (DMT)-like permease